MPIERVIAKQLMFKMIDENNMEDYEELVEDAHTKYNLLEVRSNGVTPLLHALKSKNSKAAEILLAAKADCNVQDKDGNTPLMVALEHGHHETALALLDAKAHPCTESESLLMYAVAINDEKHVDQLIALKADPNLKKYGSTALYAAIEFNHSAKYVPKLLEAKADPNLKHDEDESPLYLAIEKADINSIRLLINAKADVNNLNHGETAPLVHAVLGTQKSTQICKILLAAKADINNQVKSSGLTALHTAVIHNNPDLVKLLLDNKANPMIENAKGQTALALAHQESIDDSNAPTIIKLLEEVTLTSPKTMLSCFSGFWKTKTPSEHASEGVKEAKAKPY